MGNKGTTHNGWHITDRGIYRFYVNNPAPRRGYWRQHIRFDLRSPLVWMVWLAILLRIAFYLRSGATSDLIWVVGLVAMYANLFYQATKGRNDATLHRVRVSGIAALDKRLSTKANIALVPVTLDDGEEVEVAIPTMPVRRLIEEQGGAELLVAATPKQRYALGIAARA